MNLLTRDRLEEVDKDQTPEDHPATRGAFWKNKLIATPVLVLVISSLMPWGVYELRMLWTSYASVPSFNCLGATGVSFRNIAIRGTLTTF